MRLSYKQPRNQRAVLQELAGLTYRAIPTEKIQLAAKQIIADCPARDDECELRAIYNAVKTGDPRLAEIGLGKGLRYNSDPRQVDFFTAPNRLLEFCEKGGCGGDCDDHAALVAALAGAIGFAPGLRAWGPGESKSSELVHVYAVVQYPKNKPVEVVGLDTTVPEADVGWEPDSGHVITAWVED